MTNSRNQADKDLHEALRDTGCVCCRLAKKWNFKIVPLSPPFIYTEINHRLSGTTRMGHQFVIPECSWHHRAVAPMGMTKTQASLMFGPSRANGSKLFRKVYGSDEALQSIAMEAAGLQ